MPIKNNELIFDAKKVVRQFVYLFSLCIIFLAFHEFMVENDLVPAIFEILGTTVSCIGVIVCFFCRWFVNFSEKELLEYHLNHYIYNKNYVWNILYLTFCIQLFQTFQHYAVLDATIVIFLSILTFLCYIAVRQCADIYVLHLRYKAMRRKYSDFHIFAKNAIEKSRKLKDDAPD